MNEALTRTAPQAPAAQPKKEFLEFTPFGSTDKIKLSVALVQKFLAVPTKSGRTCSERDAMRFQMLCAAKGLNPWEGDAYLVGYDNRETGVPTFSLITAHQAFLKRAELNPEYDGMKSGIILLLEDGSVVDREGDFHLPEERVVGGWASVFFKSRKYPITRRLRLDRFNTGFAEWKKDPAGMIVKCFDEQTEVLTTRGFEKFANAEGSILQVTESGLRPTEAIPFAQDYTGEMVLWNSRNGNFCVTPNHDLPLAINGEREMKVEARHLGNMRQRDHVLMPLSRKFERKDYPIEDKFLKLAAIYVADGSDNSRSSGFRVAVSRPHKIELLRSIGIHTSAKHVPCAGDVTETSGRTIVTKSNKTAFYFARFPEVDWLVGRGKQIQVEALLSLSPHQAQLFVDTWLACDGQRADNMRVGRIYSSRKDHLAAFEMAATLAGYSVGNRTSRTSDISNRPSFSVTASDRSTINLSRQSLKMIPNPTKRVWCVKVPSGTIVVRRDGFSAICYQCSEADSLRSAFPTKLGGLYSREEHQPAIEISSDLVSTTPAAMPQLPPTTDGKDVDESAPAGAVLPTTATPESPVNQEPPKAKTLSPQDQLRDFVLIECGCTFTDFQKWAITSGNIKDADSLPGFEAVADADAKRLLRAKTGLATAVRGSAGKEPTR